MDWWTFGDSFLGRILRTSFFYLVRIYPKAEAFCSGRYLIPPLYDVYGPTISFQFPGEFPNVGDDLSFFKVLGNALIDLLNQRNMNMNMM